ncbi:hypothetical protein C8R47DRAFT_1230303 [Mycena vitilis]|nr:hypothetical protein C8R47DRAFT_1230303 [Mycena vitilis]
MAEKRKRQGKARKRVPKQNRKNLRLWAEGARETVLTPHIEGYADALERGWRAERDYLQAVCNEFHAKIDWRLADHEEPELPLKEYNPFETVEAEVLEPEVETAQRTRMLELNARIQRWFKYRVRRLQKNLQSKLDPLKNPWAILVAQLSGVTSPPKARQAYQQFMHEAYDEVIAPAVASEWAAKASEGGNIQTSKSPTGPFRALVSRQLFGKLSASERAGYAARAKEVAAEARAKYESAMKAPPSKSPEERDKCIAAVGKFLGPIMKGIFERTGMHCCFLMGGPVPKFGGELRTIYASYGRNKVPGGGAHFPEWAGGRFNYVTELMKEYLSTAFTAQDRAEAALSEALLAGAKYTLLPEGSDDASDSDSSHSSGSDSDSNIDSDDTDVPEKKHRRTKGKAKVVPQDSEGENDDNEEENRVESMSEWKLGDAEASFVPTQEERNLYGGGEHGRHQAMVARRNALMLAPLKAQWKEALGGMGTGPGTKEKPAAKKRKAKPKEAIPAAPRKSRRLNEGRGATSASSTSPANPASGGAPVSTRTTPPNATNGSAPTNTQMTPANALSPSGSTPTITQTSGGAPATPQITHTGPVNSNPAVSTSGSAPTTTPTAPANAAGSTGGGAPTITQTSGDMSHWVQGIISGPRKRGGKWAEIHIFLLISALFPGPGNNVFSHYFRLISALFPGPGNNVFPHYFLKIS